MNKGFSDLNQDRIIEAAVDNPMVLQWIVKQMAEAQVPEDVLRDLARGEGDDAERVFDRAFNLPGVGDDGRNVLLAFAPFALSATREALGAVAGFGGDLARLDDSVKKLSDLGLVEKADKSGRLFVRGLTREFVKQRLEESGRADEFYRRFIEYFLKYAEEHASRDEKDFRALEAEKGNGANAMHMAFQRHDWKSMPKFFLALKEFLDRHWYWNDLIDLSEKALFAVQKATEEGLTERDAELQEIVKQIPAIIGIHHHDSYAAREAYGEALRYYKPKWRAAPKGSEERKGYAYHLGITLHQMGVLRQYEGDLRRARRWYNWSLHFKEECETQRGIASVLNNLGVIAEQEGDKEEAARLLHQALDIFKQLESAYEVITSRNLARLEAPGS
jgi:tetratricopeptide (TPR) repeat protein